MGSHPCGHRQRMGILYPGAGSWSGDFRAVALSRGRDNRNPTKAGLLRYNGTGTGGIIFIAESKLIHK